MINIRIFSDLLDCAYDLDILIYQQSEPEKTYDISTETFAVTTSIRTQSAYILTNDGVVELTVEEKLERTDKGVVTSYSTKVKNGLHSISDELLKDLVQTQLETEAFLDNKENSNCICELVA